jgi:hypothetical protein
MLLMSDDPMIAVGPSVSKGAVSGLSHLKSVDKIVALPAQFKHFSVIRAFHQVSPLPTISYGATVNDPERAGSCS